MYNLDINVKLEFYDYVPIEIKLPTHYNKHSKIFNSYKYDIKSMVLEFLRYKIKSNQIYFTVNGQNGLDYIDEISKLPKHKLKPIYTKLSGLLVKQDKRFYTEYLHSSISVMEELLSLNQKLGLDFKVLKIFVDELVVDQKLIIENIPNVYGYNFELTKFKLFVKQTENTKKQIYITESDILYNHSFVNDNNMFTDLVKLWQYGCDFNQVHQFTVNLITGNYDVKKLIQEDSEGKQYIYSDGVKLPYSEYLDDVEYDKEYYYRIYQDIASNMVLAKNL